MKHLWVWLLCLPCVLSACGGGGGGSTEAPAVVSITSQPTDRSVVAGQAAQFAIGASNATGYQWQSNDGSGWTHIVGANGTSLEVPATTIAMDGLQYRVLVAGREAQLISSAVTLHVVEVVVAPAIVAEPASQTVTDGQDAVFHVTASGSSLAYQWESSPDGNAWSLVAGATDAQLRVVAATESLNGTRYRARIANSAGAIHSAAAVLTVEPVPVAPAFVSAPADVAVTAGQSATLSVVAAGTPVPTLQWQRSADGSTWTDIPGATAVSYTIPAASLSDDGLRFRAVASNAAGMASSTAARLTVSPAPVAPTFTLQPSSVSATAGTSVTFTVAASGTPAPALQWQVSSDAATWLNVNGATAATHTLVVSGADHGRLFRAVAANVAGSATSQVVAVAIDAAAANSPSLSLFSGLPGGTGGLDGLGSAARLASVTGMAFDSKGDLVFTGWIGNTVRKMSPSGMVTTWAGMHGQAGHADGSGLTARFDGAYGVAVDNADNVYIAERGGTLRKISPSGQVTTFAQISDAWGVAADSAGNVYVCDSSSITRITPSGTVSTVAGQNGVQGHVDGVGAAARFMAPAGIAIAPNGDLLVTDRGAHTLRRIAPDGTVSTIAGTPGVSGHADGAGAGAQFFQPSGIAVDSSGDSYVVEVGNRTVRKITAVGVVSTVAGSPYDASGLDGPISDARFSFPEAIAIAASGDLYIGDGNRIRRISGSTVATVAGNDHQRGGGPIAVVADSAGNVYVANSGDFIRKYSPDGSSFTTFAGSSNPGSADGTGVNASFYLPGGMAIDAADNIYVADTHNHTIRVITPAGVVSTLAGAAGQAGSADGVGSAARFERPARVAVDAGGNVYVTDNGNHTIRKILPDRTVITLSGLAGVPGHADGVGSAARYKSPYSIAVDANGIVFVSDQSGTIRRIDASGRATTFAGMPNVFGSVDGTGPDARFGSSPALAFWNGTLHAGDNSNGTLRTIDASGTVKTIAGVAGQIGVRLGADARLNFLGSLAPLDANRLLISTRDEDSVLIFTK